MYVTHIEETDKRKVMVYVDKGEGFPLYKGEVKKYGIMEHKELSESEYRYILSDVLIKRGKERAMHILQGADRTEKQMREKLEKGGYPITVIDAVIDFLLKYDYIDDYNYAISYIRTYGKSQSERLMREKLRQKGVDRETADSAMNKIMSEIDYDSESIIIDILKKKKYAKETADIKEKNRIISHLLRKGFRYEDILDAIRHYKDN